MPIHHHVEAAPIPITSDDLATPWQRLGAAFVDAMLISVPTMFLMIVMFFDGEPADVEVPLLSTLVSTTVFAAYEVVGTALWGQTFGKHLVGIRVCSGGDPARPGWLRAAKRWGLFLVVGYVPFVGSLLSLVIPLPLVWDHSRQGLHDKFADTLVLRNRSVPWA